MEIWDEVVKEFNDELNKLRTTDKWLGTFMELNGPEIN